MPLEFKIGRLRYTWRGAWVTGTFYNRDAVSQFNGKTYVCLEPHTAQADFYDDLYYIRPEDGASLPRWELMIDGRSWKQDWTPSTSYALGNIVRYGGVVYICIENHTSGATVIDLTKWTTYAQFDEWNNSWQTSVDYSFGEIVRYGGIVYRCIVDHQSAATELEGLEANQADWEIVNSGIEYTGDWAYPVRYKLNDLTKIGADIYICNEGHESDVNLDPTKWDLWLPGQEYTDGWDNQVIYQPGDIVIYGGYSYICLTDNNVNNIPSTASLDWELVTQGYNMTGDWTSGAYRVGELVRRSGNLYVAISDNDSEDPLGSNVITETVLAGTSGTTVELVDASSVLPGMIVLGTMFTKGQTVVSVDINNNLVVLNDEPEAAIPDGTTLNFIGVNFNFWRIVVPGLSWKRFWNVDDSYTLNDITLWQNRTYRCINPHSSTPLTRPDLDILREYWIVLSDHAKENAGNTQGDIVTFSNGETVAVPILPEDAEDGATEDYLFRVNGYLPNWAKFGNDRDVYYVAPDGADEDGYGESPDKPWKSIQHACSIIERGTMNLNASELLRTNKEFLIEEMWLWMQYQKDNNNAPFTPTSVYDEYSTKRDARLVLDAIDYDITRGSNSRTITATQRYFSEFSKTTFFNEETAAAQDYIVASLTQLASTLDEVYQNNTVPSYQETVITINGTGVTVVAGEIITQANNPLASGEVRYSTTGTEITLIKVTGSFTLNEDDLLSASVSGDLAEFITDIDTDGIISQNIDLGLAFEDQSRDESSSLFNILIGSIANANINDLPLINQSSTATVLLKTGTYEEELPIVVPDYCAVVGDELRGAVVRPKNVFYGTAYMSDVVTNTIILQTVEGLLLDQPIQFSADTVNDDFGSVTLGKTYYVIAVAEETNSIKISETIGGDEFMVTNGSGTMNVFAGDCLKDMFYMRNATGLRNCTLTGLSGSLGELNEFATRRPTGPAYTSLDPGTGPDDTKGWIVSRSPYIQNVTNFGTGCVGMKIDGLLHNGGNRSMVANDYTQILSDGIGVWCTGPNSLTECVSVFTYYNYAGYFAEDGGRIRATNGNSSYGTFGVVAEGFDDTEVPISGLVDNQSQQVQASVQSSFGLAAELLAFQYNNAGSNYTTLTTNFVKHSNIFDEAEWVSSNVQTQKNNTSPFGDSDGWTLTGLTSNTTDSYIYQNISVAPPGASYTNLEGVNVSGSGLGATFDITVGATEYFAIVNSGGTGYVTSNILRIPGSQLGGKDGANDCFLEVSSLTGSSILSVIVTGNVPTNSDQNYTASLYVKQGSASTIDFEMIFSGVSSPALSTISSFNFNTLNFTNTTSNGGAAVVAADKLELTDGWYRIWVTFYDANGLNDTLQFRIYPRGMNDISGNTRVYGAQIQLGADPTFYLETNTVHYPAYANFSITGAGTGAYVIADEIRSNAIFQTRLTDITGYGEGGRGYKVSSNNAQTGTTSTVTLSGSDTALESEYIGMRVFLQSGTGAGQYGYIASFDDAVSKIAKILKESFEPLEVTSTSSATNYFTMTVDTTDTLYVGMPMQFIPTYYSTSVSNTSIDFVNVSESIGGATNTYTVESTAKLTVNMKVRFVGATFGGVVEDFTYYIKEIIDETTIKISTEPFGADWLLNSDTGTMDMYFPGYNNYLVGSTASMSPNMPIRFTGTTFGGITAGQTYYINDVYDLTRFSISTTLVEFEVTDTTAATDYITTTSTTGLVPLNPIDFSGDVFGNIVAGVKYYINKIVNATTFTITDSLIVTTATETAAITNLITVDSTAGLIVNNPIQFIGNTFGGITNGQTYYVLAVNDATTLTISASPGGSAINLSGATGNVEVKSTSSNFTLVTATGTMDATTTNAKSTLTDGYGTLNGQFTTKLFGTVSLGTDYYVNSIVDSTNFTVSATPGGADLVLKTAAGSMNVAATGWDHINPGTPIENSLDNSTVYYVEPRISITAPNTTQVAATTNTLAPGSQWKYITYGNGLFLALPDTNAVAATSPDGENWTAFTLPESKSWAGAAYGIGRWVIITSGGPITNDPSTVYYSVSNTEGWRAAELPTQADWRDVVFGNGVFVAIANNSSDVAYSLDGGMTWALGSGLPSSNWTSMTYGNGKFVAVQLGSSVVAYSSNGINWTTSNLPTISDWIDIVCGNGLFIAISNLSEKPVYSRNAIDWFESPYTLDPLFKISYGQGVFVAISNTSGDGYTTEDGITWTKVPFSNDAYGDISFGWVGDNYEGKFVTVSGQTVASIISAGCRTKGRASVTSGRITSIGIWEPGSNYSAGGLNTISITDPNTTLDATVDLRYGVKGTLANPTFINRGENYNTNSTVIKIQGAGFADIFQTGLTITVKNLTSLPGPGDNLVIDGNDTVYKVTNATAVYGTTAPNIKANIQIAPDMTVAKSPAHDAAVTIRQKYSQARLTGHDFLNVGYGNELESNYPFLPDDTVLAPQDQAVEVNYGRVFYQSTDQDGNFNVGGLFGVEQATGIVTLSASQFGLQGLETLQLGGISVGGSSVVIRQFSTDETFIANSNNIIPTQRAIKAYLESRLTQGGSNTFTGQLIAGTVLVGGPNRIASTIPEGLPGARVMMPVPIRVQGQFAGWDGDGMAYSYFVKTWNHR